VKTILKWRNPMGRLPTGKRKYEIKRLKDYHYTILERLVRGHKPRDIARDLGISTQTISNVSNSTIAQEVLRKMNAERDAEAIDIARSIKQADYIFRIIEDYPHLVKRAREIEEMLSGSL